MDKSLGPKVYRAGSPTAVTQIRIPRELGNSNSNAVPEVNYPILFLGSVGIAIVIFIMRERVKNVHNANEPVLTVVPSTDADVSQVENIQHLVNFDLSVYDARKNAELQN